MSDESWCQWVPATAWRSTSSAQDNIVDILPEEFFTVIQTSKVQILPNVIKTCVRLRLGLKNWVKE